MDASKLLKIDAIALSAAAEAVDSVAMEVAGVDQMRLQDLIAITIATVLANTDGLLLVRDMEEL